MSVGYRMVQWNAAKRGYDAWLFAGIAAYLITFVVLGKLSAPAGESFSDEILAMRALGTCAFLMLHVVLCIGPLARLDARFAPLLYNRRHMGVATFLVALGHGALAIGFYHGFGNLHPLLSVLVSNTNYGSISAFPFQPLGLAALVILFVMAATSHDFWNRNLGPRIWKSLHMSVYVAYALLVAHVALGALQTQRDAVTPALVTLGALTVTLLHIVAGLREARHDRATGAAALAPNGWIDACDIDEIPHNRARVVCVPGRERVAIFRHDGGVSAVTNVCVHQGGPLGEGKVIDGCITCPWHGWQYRPADGQSPPPFAEKIATYRLRLVGTRVQLCATPLPPGTPIEPVRSTQLSEAAGG